MGNAVIQLYRSFLSVNCEEDAGRMTSISPPIPLFQHYHTDYPVSTIYLFDKRYDFVSNIPLLTAPAILLL